MKLVEIKIENFKSIEKLSLQFNEKFNAFTGKNGIGKTNLLDAIYFLCAGKSYFNSLDSQLIRNEEEYFNLSGEFIKENEKDQVQCALVKGRKKLIRRNDIPYERIIEHFGTYPVVIIAPNDIEIINGGSEERRKWMDSTISTHDRDYLMDLMKYDKILQQRNAELKNLASNEKPDKKVIEIYDLMIVPLAESIHKKRLKFIDDFMPFFNSYYQIISNDSEEVNIQYHSQLSESKLSDLLKDKFKHDLILQRTNYGTHKDDLEFTIFKQTVKKFASHGQQKTLIFSLKLAQYKYIQGKKDISPLLLLDDVCERLDEHRINNLMTLINQAEFGQIFLTDTSAKRIKDHISNSNISFFDVENFSLQ